MTAVITAAVVVAYLVVAVLLARPILHAIGTEPGYCSKIIDGYYYGPYDRAWCRAHHPAGCWHPGETWPLTLTLSATAVSLVWPLAVLPLWLRRTPIPPEAPAMRKRIAELERDLGIGGTP